MAKEIAVILKAKDEASQAIRGLSRTIEGLKSPLLAVSGVASVLGLVSLGQHLRRGVEQSIKAAAEQEKAEAAVAQALRNRGVAVKDALPPIVEMAQRLQGLTGIEDDLILSGQALLISIGGLSGQGLERATKAALDLGTMTGNVEGAFQALAKAAAGNLRGLQQVGIRLDENVPKSERLAAAIDLIASKFGGQAVAQAKTFEGQTRLLTVAWGELQETLGLSIIQSPAVQKIMAAIGEGIADLTKGVEGADFEPIIRDLASGILALVDVGITATEVVGGLSGAVLAFAKDVGEADFSFDDLRAFVSDTPAWSKALEDLRKRVGDTRAELDGASVSAAGLAKSTAGASRTSQEFAKDLARVDAVSSAVNIGVGVLALNIGAKLYGAAKRGASGLLDLTAYATTADKEITKLTGDIFKTLSVTDAWSLASKAQKVALVGIAAGVGVLSYELTRAILQVTGLDNRIQKFIDKARNALPDASDAFKVLKGDVELVDRAVSVLEKKGIRLGVDTKLLEDARESIQRFEFFPTAKVKIGIAANTTEARAQLAQLRDDIQVVLRLQRDNPEQFTAIWEKAAKKTAVFGERVKLAKAGIDELRTVSQKAGPAIAESFDDILKDLDIKPLADLRAEAGRLEKAYRRVGEESEKGLIPPERARVVLDEIIEQITKLEKQGIRVNIEVAATTDAGKKLADLRKELGLDEQARRLITFDVELRKVGADPFGDLEKKAADLRAALESALTLESLPGTDRGALAIATDQLVQIALQAGLTHDQLAKLFEGIDFGGAQFPRFDQGLEDAAKRAAQFEADLKSGALQTATEIAEARLSIGQGTEAELSAARIAELNDRRDREIAQLQEIAREEINAAGVTAEARLAIETGTLEQIAAIREKYATLLAAVPDLAPWEQFSLGVEEHFRTAVQNIGTQWADFVTGATDQFANLAGAVLTGQASVAEAGQRLLRGLAAEAIALLVRQAVARVAANRLAVPSIAKAHAAQLAGSLAAVYANVFASIAAIPVVGPFLAPAAAAAALAAATAGSAGAGAIGAGLGAGLGAVGGLAEGGIVPGRDSGTDTVLAVTPGGKRFGLRPEELVLPPPEARALMARARDAGVTSITGPGGFGLTPGFLEFLRGDQGGRGIEAAAGGFAQGGGYFLAAERLGGGAAVATLLASGAPPPGAIRNAAKDFDAETMKSVLEGLAPEITVEVNVDGDFEGMIDKVNARVRRGSLLLYATDVASPWARR